MKKKLIFAIAILFSVSAFSQTIIATSPTEGQTISVFNNRIPVSATLDQTAYAVVFSIDPIGETKVLHGKNVNAGAAATFPSSRGDYKYYWITVILNRQLDPTISHTLRVDVYGKNFRDLVDTKEITFYIE